MVCYYVSHDPLPGASFHCIC